jgi:imidazole glycerol-phosphate synthase subunit HisH
MVAQTVQLIDAGTGNLQSVFNALQNLGADICVISEAAGLKPGLRTILPGVGAFRKFMEGMNDRGMVDPVCEIAASGVPLLGICVGMQAMFDTSEEMGDTPGMSLILGKVRRFPETKEYKVPQTGWNSIEIVKPSPLFHSISSGSFFYFNHSYYCQPDSADFTLAVTDYILPFSPVVGNGNVFGVQFHPEKSQILGQTLLSNFLAL